MVKRIISVQTDLIDPHPQNPRKDVGDVSELAESIRKNGIMQNLTVVPQEGKDRYTVVIGHRRLAAAKQAGLTEVPVTIADLTPKEQLTIMLEENMQRADLTIPEQAEGFQLLIDLGETAESIAKKTGFSKTTIYHRLNLAKLDQDVLKKRTEGKGSGRQLTITDLYALEEVNDEKERNRILKDAADGNAVVFMVDRYKKELYRKRNKEDTEKHFADLGIKQMPKGMQNGFYSLECLKETRINLESEEPFDGYDELKEDIENLLSNEKIYWRDLYNIISVTITVDEKKKESREDRKKAEREKRKQELIAIEKSLIGKVRAGVKILADGKISLPADSADETISLIRFAAANSHVYIDPDSYYSVIHDMKSWNMTGDQRNEAKDMMRDTPIYTFFLTLLSKEAMESSIVDYTGSFKDYNACILERVVRELQAHGMEPLEEAEEQVLTGTHPMYTRKEDNKKKDEE